MRGALFAAALLLGCAAPPEARLQELSVGRYVMGTLLEITLHAPEAEAGEVAEELVRLARRLEAQLSRYDPDSALSRLNARAGAGPQPVPPALARILVDAVAYSRTTRGSFDVSVGPLVELWTRAARLDRLPSGAELAEARQRVGAERMGVSLAAGTVELERGMSLDLGGVAKGWTLDRMRERLLARGVERALVVFGGSSILALGAPPQASGWRVLLENGAGSHAGVLTLRDAALSVSGSFGRSSRIAGRRYGHVIDPRTGLPLAEGRQAAILAPTGAAAEALSKALLVLEPEAGLGLITDLPGAEGMLLREGGAPLATPGWREASAFEAAPALRGPRRPARPRPPGLRGAPWDPRRADAWRRRSWR